MKSRALLIFLFLFSLFGAVLTTVAETNKDTSQSGVLSASMMPPSARVGSVVALILHYALPEGARLSDKVGIKGLDGLTVLGLENIPSGGGGTPAGEKNLSGEIRIKLLVDKLGSLTTGPLSVAYLDKKGAKAALDAEPTSLNVLSNLGEKPEEAVLKPIYGIMPTGFAWKKEVLWGAAILLLCLLAGGFFWWRKRSGVGMVGKTPRILPHVAARERIQALEGEKLFERGQLKVFYFRFSEIMRRYLEELRGFPAVEFTTQEIALAIKEGKDRDLLQLLKQADLVKFADYKPTQARKEEEVKKALGYIEDTCESFEKDINPPLEEKTGEKRSIRKRLRGGRRFP